MSALEILSTRFAYKFNEFFLDYKKCMMLTDNNALKQDIKDEVIKQCVAFINLVDGGK